MKKINYTLLLFCLAIGFTACKKNLGIENFDVDGQFRRDTTAIRAFAVANNIPIVKDPTYNIFYQIIKPGEGPDIEIKPLSNLSVTYTGRLLNGKAFDTQTTPTDFFPLSGMITGWEVGIPILKKKGGKIRLLLPSVYGYGNLPYGPIPANSVLDFDVEIVDVK